MDFKKLLTRTLSGIIYCAIIILCILWSSSAVTVMASAFATLAVIEFTKMTSGNLSKRIPTLLLDIAGCICLCCGTYIIPIALWLIVIICRFIEELYIKDEDPLKSLGTSALSQIYIGVPLGCMVAIAYLFARPEALLAVFFFLWINDTGAFLTGSLFGRHKLFERISPKKSWEGFIGGYIFN
ncbi:MAG: phosphatidate cytidylyltransferase, partial [Muribaculaceae bacterium]|nr:phosphatidate cytidylyltransferase [Muribaculaceae bacterium]